MKSVNPATLQVIREYSEHTESAVDQAIVRAAAAFPAWRDAGFERRAAVLRGVARLLRDEKREHSELMTREMGKPIAAAEAELEKCAWVSEYYAEHAELLLAPETIPTEASDSHVRFDPLGVVLAIMPWNFPYWQVFRFLAPALMAGNVGLLKHASNVCGVALAIEGLLSRAGAPAGVFTTLIVPPSAIEKIVARPEIAAATLTGSDAAGRALAAACGRHLKKVVLELGGSDPFVVLGDADLDAAASEAVKARVVNSGQSCIAAKRFIVERPLYSAFESRFVQKMSALEVGDPLARTTEVGPLAREDLLGTLERQVKESVAQGARLTLGGKRLARTGFYYAPTVLSDVAPGMPAFDQETFGPVAALSAADDADHAVRLANTSRFGLGAAIWTRDTARARALSARIEAGVVFVNGMVKSDPRLPFGGVKESGFGRELGSFGIREFVNIKSVWVV